MSYQFASHASERSLGSVGVFLDRSVSNIHVKLRRIRLHCRFLLGLSNGVELLRRHGVAFIIILQFSRSDLWLGLRGFGRFEIGQVSLMTAIRDAICRSGRDARRSNSACSEHRCSIGRWWRFKGSCSRRR